MGDFCRRGVRPYRSTYRFLRADATCQQRALDELRGKNAKPSKASLSC